MELPSDTPLGKATLQLTATPTPIAQSSWDDLKTVFGVLKDDPLFQGDLDELKKATRDE
ncbi:MAG: hypothetical protein LBO66_03955 [Deltaproteobacteria bacterium]|nr:hypothetical protein [Deltaproteobacteria bacterium]